jgi:hypothetical protein
LQDRFAFFHLAGNFGWQVQAPLLGFSSICLGKILERV